MLDSVYAVLGVNSWSLHREIERDDLTSSSWVMVELRTRKREMRGDGGNHHEKLGLKKISCASQLTILDTAGTSPDPPCNITHTRSSQPNQASRTPDFSYSHLHPLSISFSSTTRPSSQNTMLCHPSHSPHARNMSWHRVQHTLSTAYTEYSLHRAQLTPSTAFTYDCSSSLHSHDYELTPECGCSFRRTSLHDRPTSASSPWELQGKSHCHIPTVASQLTDE